eukprot:850056_1
MSWGPQRLCGECTARLTMEQQLTEHEGVRDRLFEIAKQNSTHFDAVNDRREIPVQKNHVGRVLRHLRTGDAHRHTDVGMAVIGWSPVTMMTLIPAVWHLATACGTPG